MKEPTLPFVPESTARLAARYPAALKALFDARETVPSPRPGELRGHVFDFDDGLRLIVSRDLMKDGEFLHVSASVMPPCQMYSDIKQGNLKPKAFAKIALKRFAVISHDTGKMDLLGFSEGKGVPHWFRRL